MSATEKVAGTFSAMCDAYCDMHSCDDCPVYASTMADEDCFESFARLLRESKAEPWEARALNGRWCSICTHRVPEGAKACPTCGAAIREGGDAR